MTGQRGFAMDPDVPVQQDWNQTFNYVNLTNHRIVQSGHLGRSKWPDYYDSSREMWYLYFMMCSKFENDYHLQFNPGEYTRQLYLPSVRRDFLRIENFNLTPTLTPVFQFLIPGRRVSAITALTDTFWKQHINNLKKLEAMREKKSPCKW